MTFNIIKDENNLERLPNGDSIGVIYETVKDIKRLFIKMNTVNNV